MSPTVPANLYALLRNCDVQPRFREYLHQVHPARTTLVCFPDDRYARAPVARGLGQCEVAGGLLPSALALGRVRSGPDDSPLANLVDPQHPYVLFFNAVARCRDRDRRSDPGYFGVHDRLWRLAAAMIESRCGRPPELPRPRSTTYRWGWLLGESTSENLVEFAAPAWKLFRMADGYRKAADAHPAGTPLAFSMERREFIELRVNRIPLPEGYAVPAAPPAGLGVAAADAVARPPSGARGTRELRAVVRQLYPSFLPVLAEAWEPRSEAPAEEDTP